MFGGRHRLCPLAWRRPRFPAVVAVLALAAASFQAIPGTAAAAAGGGKSSGAPLRPNQPLTAAAQRRLAAQRHPAGGLAEVPSLRTRRSDTYVAPGGEYRTVISAGSMNYRDAGGAWQPIDDTLVPSPVAGYAYQNRANAYRLLLPASLGGGVVKVIDGTQWVSYSLPGASGRGKVSGSTDSFAGAFPGVSVSYTAAPDEVKESIVLNDPAAPASFAFRVRMSAGLTVRPRNGGLAFVNSAGHTLLTVPAPVVSDASGAEAAPSAVSMTTASAPGGLTVAVQVARSWLAAPGRAWPVAIDPTTTLGPVQDCHLYQADPGTSFCGTSYLRVGEDGSNAVRRALLKFDLSSLPADAQVVDADLALFLNGLSTSNTSPLAVRQLTQSWTNGATWNSYDGTHAWASPGGDFTSSKWGNNPTVGSTVNTWIHWDPTALVQNWLDDPTDNPNDGLLIKEPSETVANLFTFSSAEGANPPTLTLEWHHMLGSQRWYKLETRTLDDRIGASVNVVSGNLWFNQHDLKIAGTAGLNLVVDRSWNSEESRGDSGDTGWRFSVGPDVQLEFFGDGSIRYDGVSGYIVGFTFNGSGYDKPPGFDGTLAKNGSNYDLTFNSGEVYEFNSSGQLISDQSPRSTATKITYSYRSDGTLATATDSQGRVVNFTYNSLGFISQITESNGPTTRTWTYNYNTAGQLTSFADPLNQTTSYGYNSNGDVSQITDPAGNVTAISYVNSTSDHVKTITLGSGTGSAATWTFTYNSSNTVVNDPNGHNTTYFHNGGANYTTDEVNKITDANGHDRTLKYDSNYNVTTLTDALGNGTSASFSSGGDLSGVTLPAVYGTQGAKESWGYSTQPVHYPTSYTSWDGQGYSLGYSTSSTLANDVTSITDPSGGVWKYSYYNDGTLNTITDPDGSAHTITLTDSGGNITKVTPPSPMGAESIGYDGLSRVTSTTDGKGQLTKFSYDALDRVTQITYNDGTIVGYNYTPDDLVSSVQVNGSTVESFAYNALNQMIKKTFANGSSVSYAFDGVGNLTSFTDASGSTSYGYDPANNLTKLTGPGGSPVITFTATNDNLRSSTVFATSPQVTEATAYDKANRPCLIVAAPSASIPSPLTCNSTVAGALTSIGYNYQNNGGTDTNRIQSATDNVSGKTTTYKYWADQELCYASPSGASAACSSPAAGATSYVYDGAGNITSETGPSGSTTNYTTNNDNELTSAGSTSYTYDANGNLTSGSNGWAYSYNALNQTSGVTPPGGSRISLGYTGPGQNELSQVGSDTLVNTLLGVSSKTNGSGSTYYVRDNSGKPVYEQVPGGSKYYYVADAKGSVTGLVNSGGSLVGGTPYAYDPYGSFGSGQTSVDNPWLFQGQYNLLGDQGSSWTLYHEGARYYQPSIKRWTQPDPLSSAPGGNSYDGSVLSQNRYLFASDSPISGTDPTGQNTCGIVVGVTYLIVGTLASIVTSGVAAIVLPFVIGGIGIANGELIC